MVSDILLLFNTKVISIAFIICILMLYLYLRYMVTLRERLGHIDG